MQGEPVLNLMTWSGEDTLVEEEQEEEHACRGPTKQEGSQIKKNNRNDIRTEQTAEQSNSSK